MRDLLQRGTSPSLSPRSMDRQPSVPISTPGVPITGTFAHAPTSTGFANAITCLGSPVTHGLATISCISRPTCGAASPAPWCSIMRRSISLASGNNDPSRNSSGLIGRHGERSSGAGCCRMCSSAAPLLMVLQERSICPDLARSAMVCSVPIQYYIM